MKTIKVQEQIKDTLVPSFFFLSLKEIFRVYPFQILKSSKECVKNDFKQFIN